MNTTNAQTQSLSPETRNGMARLRGATDCDQTPPAGAARGQGVARSRKRAPGVLMITEGTYPYATGGVSSWCDVLISGLEETQWAILPITAGGRRMRQRSPCPPTHGCYARSSCGQRTAPGAACLASTCALTCHFPLVCCAD